MPITKEQAQAELDRRRRIPTISTESEDLRRRAQTEMDRRRNQSIPEVPPGADVTTLPEFGEQVQAFGNEVLAESPALAGATGGAIAGGTAGGPVGAIAGALGGGTLGALTQEGVEQGMLATGVAEPGDKLISERPLEDKDIRQTLLDAGMTGIQIGAGEAAGQGLIAPFTKVGRGFSRNVTPEGKETLDFFKGTDVVPNPAKVTDSRLLDLASNAGEASIFGGEKFLQGQIKAVDLVNDTINRLTSSLSSKSRESLGDLFADAIGDTSQAFRGTADNLFRQLDDLVGTRFVDTATFRRQADQLIRELTAVSAEPTLITKLQSAGRTSVGDVGLRQTGLRFSEAQSLRSDLLDITRRSKDVISDKAKGRAKKLVGILDREMRTVAESAGALTQFERANRFWKEGINTFNDKIIRDIINKDADAAVNALFNAGKEKPIMIRRIKRALRSKELIREFENSTLKTMIFRSTDELGEVVPKKLLNQIKAFGGVDGQALKAMFPRGEDKVLAKLARIKGVLLKGQPDATGRFAVQIGQVTAGAGLIAGKFRQAALAILIVPDMIARAFRNPKIARFITEGAKARPGTKQAVTFSTRLAALLSAEGIPFEVQDNNRINEVPPGPGFFEDTRGR